MANEGQLLFGDLPSVPVLWLVGLLGFIAFWWYVCRNETRVRRIFLALWLPAAVVAGALYSLDGHGYAVSESLRLLAHRDPEIIGLVRWMPSNGFEATYDVIVGGAVAALATMALQLVGLLVGGLVGLVPSAGLNPPRPPRPSSRPGT